VENNQVDNQLNDIDPKVNDGNEVVLELYEYELVKLIHFVEENFQNPKNLKIIEEYQIQIIYFYFSWRFNS
jgi:hypothetical protein